MKLLIFLLLFTQILYSKTLKLSVSPLNSNIKINNIDYSNNLKTGVFSKDFESGEYKIEVCKKNYKCEKKTLWMMDENKELKFSLKAIKSELLITSNNINSIILVNGKQIEKNKIIEFKKDQTIDIEEIKTFFATSKMKFKIKLGSVYTLNLPELKAITQKLNIRTVKKHENMSVRLNGKEICRISKQEGILKSLTCKKDLKAGKYNIYISSEGYFPFERTVNITNKNININFELKRKTKNLEFGLGLSYLYDRLLGGYPQIDLLLKFKDKISLKVGALYVVNFSTDSEYYGLIIGSSYDFYQYEELFKLYAGVDILFSKYIDNNIDYLLNGAGINFGINVKLIKDLFINLEVNNRLHYMYNNDYYNISGKLGIIYNF